MEKHFFIIKYNDTNKRLDQFLNEQFSDLSRSYIKKIIDKKLVFINKKISKPAYKLKLNDEIEITLIDPEPTEIKPQNIPLDILYEDSDLIVINKPRNMITHPANGVYENTLVNALLYHCKDLSGIGGTLRPGIVHRLDKDTTGIIVVAKSDLAHQSLSQQIHKRIAQRFYHALVLGGFKENHGKIEAPIGRHPIHRQKMAVVENGKEALTYWQLLNQFGQFSYLELKLSTGRTHQIRVHLSYIKHPVLGDNVYGTKLKLPFKLNGPALHSYKLSFFHPKNNEKMEFIAPLPEDFQKALKYLVNIKKNYG